MNRYDKCCRSDKTAQYYIVPLPVVHGLTGVSKYLRPGTQSISAGARQFLVTVVR